LPSTEYLFFFLLFRFFCGQKRKKFFFVGEKKSKKIIRDKIYRPDKRIALKLLEGWHCSLVKTSRVFSSKLRGILTQAEGPQTCDDCVGSLIIIKGRHIFALALAINFALALTLALAS
jgi:hypothetical protein